MHDALEYGEEVKAALADGAPVVAIESSLINRALPAPERLAAVDDAMSVVREHGAVPAVLGVVGGRIKIGLDEEDRELFATADGVAKISRRDLATVVALGRHGATTVASSMICARLAGIAVFITGGIGGVHRGFEATMDVSADLEELARTNVAVVCAGAKVILDLARTLEYLETKGVPVLGYGTDDFPAYYAASGLAVDARLETAADIAAIMKAKWDLGIEGGVVVATSLAAGDAMDPDALEGDVGAALREADEQGVSGKDITPFLLSRLADLTGGKAKDVGRAAIRNNARAGAEIAKVYAALAEQGG